MGYYQCLKLPVTLPVGNQLDNMINFGQVTMSQNFNMPSPYQVNLSNHHQYPPHQNHLNQYQHHAQHHNQQGQLLIPPPSSPSPHNNNNNNNNIIFPHQNQNICLNQFNILSHQISSSPNPSQNQMHIQHSPTIKSLSQQSNLLTQNSDSHNSSQSPVPSNIYPENITQFNLPSTSLGSSSSL